MAKKKPPKPKYRVLTWDTDKQKFTPQQGVRAGRYSLMALREPLRKLRQLGYDTSRHGGVSVMVERIYTAEELAAMVEAAKIANPWEPEQKELFDANQS